MSTVRWGIIGPGRIAARLRAGLPARARGRAGRRRVPVGASGPPAFAAEHGIGRTHDSYPAIIADDGVDVLYIATPHPQHRAIALAAIRAGKAVLIEKSFTVTPAATVEIVTAARQAGVFAMEAMWTRFLPAVVRLRELIADGAIGTALAVQADLGRARRPTTRTTGSSTRPSAVAPCSTWASTRSRSPRWCWATRTRWPRTACSDRPVWTWPRRCCSGFPDGRSATLQSSLRGGTPGQARVFGTGGWIDVPPRFHHPDRIVLHRAGRDPEEFHLPVTGGGFTHELIEVTECVAAGRTESAVMPLADTVAVQDVMGAVADQIGLVPQEGPAELAF